MVGAPALALVAASALATPAGPAAAEPPAQGNPLSAADAYINYAAPNTEKAVASDVALTTSEKKNKAKLKQAADNVGDAIDRKYAGGNPRTARVLAKTEQQAIKAGESPRRFKQAPKMQEAKLLTILVEFNEKASYDWSGVMVPKTVFGDRTCVPAQNVPAGPLHNQIPNPANFKKELGAVDNNSFWVPNFSPEHYDKMLYTKEGITDRVRTDLKGPDGNRGFDISGYTMRNMYEEMSKGAYTVTGQATNWVKLDNSEAYYAADTCYKDDKGEWQPGAYQDMDGYPKSGGPSQMAIDAVNKLAATQPDFPFADYDVEDQGDIDGDGNLYEPDGVIDHVVIVHAGEDKSGGGGAEGTYAIWAHSSAVAGGAPVGNTGLKVSNYIVQPEDSGVGVFAHEYGHDLGLPDLYDTSSGGDSDVDFWDLMSSGSHAGPIFQSMPTHMGLWDKWVLGWADPMEFEPGDKGRTVQVGQTSRTPRGTQDGLKIDLPNKVVHVADPHSGKAMWWNGADGNWQDNTLSRSMTVPAAGDVKAWMWNNYVIEKDWDFGFVEVSTDNGASWTQLKVYSEDGTEVSTPDGYSDPNGRLHDYGDLKHGLTGSSDGWRHDYVDLTPYAGQTVQFRLRSASDAAFLERGWFADDFSLVADGTTVWSDDVESGENGWTSTRGTFVAGEPLGTGWHIDSGTQVKAQYYLAEWRNFDGFDEGLKYTYDTTYSSYGPWKVQKIKYNAPGMLVWYRDTTYGNSNAVLANTYDLPSTGTKGGLLIVDSHYNPLRRTGKAAQKDASTLKNLPSRPQSSNAAFGHDTYPFTECLAEVPGEDWGNEYCTKFGWQPAVKTFTDAKGWYPGLEVRTIAGQQRFFFRDIDASVVVPNRDNAPYPVRITDENGNPRPDLYGTDLGLGVPLGDGNPTQPYGVKLEVVKSKQKNEIGQIRVTPAKGTN